MSRSAASFVKQQHIPHPVGTANGFKMSEAKGKVSLQLEEDPVEVQQVPQIPELTTNLFSVSKMCEKGLSMVLINLILRPVPGTRGKWNRY